MHGTSVRTAATTTCCSCHLQALGDEAKLPKLVHSLLTQQAALADVPADGLTAQHISQLHELASAVGVEGAASKWTLSAQQVSWGLPGAAFCSVSACNSSLFLLLCLASRTSLSLAWPSQLPLLPPLLLRPAAATPSCCCHSCCLHRPACSATQVVDARTLLSSMSDFVKGQLQVAPGAAAVVTNGRLVWDHDPKAAASAPRE